MDVPGQVFEAFFYGIKAGIGAEKRKVRCPDMSRNKDRLRAGVQCDLQQITGVEPQDGTAVGMQVADTLQRGSQPIGGIYRRQQYHVMHLAHAVVLFIYTGYLSRNEKAAGRNL